MSNFWDNVQGLAEKAPEAGFANVSFGKLTTKALVMRWEGPKGSRKPVYTPYVDGYAVDTEHGESLALELTVDIQELNPALEFNLIRTVEIKKSSSDRRALTDWSEILEPSLIASFGAKWAGELNKGHYVKIESVPQVNGGKKEGGKAYTTIKILEVYKDKAACVAAHELQFARKDGETGEVTTSAPAAGIPAEIVAQVKTLIGSVGLEITTQAIAKAPFDKYDAGELLKLAQNG